MYLPDLIRQGSELTDKITGSYYYDESTCAVGAGAVGIVGKGDEKKVSKVSSVLANYLDEYWIKVGDLPESNTYRVNDNAKLSIYGAVTMLNDAHDMSRKAIAEWLEHTFDDDVLTIDPDDTEDEEDEEERELVPA
jgi:hypothetical protein